MSGLSCIASFVETELATLPSSSAGNISIYPVTDIYLLQENPIFHSLYKESRVGLPPPFINTVCFLGNDVDYWVEKVYQLVR